MKHIIILNGAPDSGKGVFAGFFDPQATTYTSIVMATKVLAVQDFGWDGVKDAAGRKLLSDLHEAAMAYNNAPLHGVISTIFAVKTKTIIADVRDVRIIARLRRIVQEAGLKCTTVLIIRDVAQAAAEEDELAADCDTAGRGFRYDRQLVNNGTIEEFKALAINALGVLE